MKNKRTITIGIPAYNEEANIGVLIKSLLSQVVDDLYLEKIIVVSDGSTDRTVEEVRKVRDTRINLIDYKKRKGLNPVQNKILELCKSDFLVIINADALPKDNYLLKNLPKPFLNDSRVGLVSARIKSVKAATFVGKVLANSHELKESIYQKINRGNNVYLCHGQVRAFSKAFYTSLRWPYDVPEDSYSYFECIKKGLKFVYVKDTVVIFAPSSTIRDHIRQSKRFTDGLSVLKKILGSNEIRNGYRMPIIVSLFYVGIFFLRNPVLTLGYIIILISIYFFTKDQKIDHSRFEISKSSKKLFT